MLRLIRKGFLGFAHRKKESQLVAAAVAARIAVVAALYRLAAAVVVGMLAAVAGKFVAVSIINAV